uniref:Uncharacterized protein n=1 Tax=Nelumbo nucifera TaxID=4432 RepID=A0A822XZT0_NELNU|nr:TPA_asm: hypothetical protein HUJ06_025769 [Nelumbo nucifera]
MKQQGWWPRGKTGKKNRGEMRFDNDGRHRRSSGERLQSWELGNGVFEFRMKYREIKEGVGETAELVDSSQMGVVMTDRGSRERVKSVGERSYRRIAMVKRRR